MRKVAPIELRGKMSVGELIRQYERTGVLGAGAIAKAVAIYEEMLSERALVFLGLAGPLIPAGLRRVIADLIRSRMVHVVVTSGANVVHDMIEAFGGRHYVGSFNADDAALKKRGVGRMGNVYMSMDDFVVFEKRCQEILSNIEEERRLNLSVRELLVEIGAQLEDRDSFLRAAYESNTPVFSPAVTDSMLGLQLFFYSQEEKLLLNVLKDMKDIADLVFEAEKTGAIILGGGVPKHYILGVSTLRGGVDYAIQITADRGEAGSLSGAKLEEAISWGKAKEKGKLVSITGDATLLFPLLVAGVKERLKDEEAHKDNPSP